MTDRQLVWRGKAFEAARRKGREARDRNESISTNPYPDERTDRGSVTFSRAFIRAWNHGWKERDAELMERKNAI